jgi:hypothetical protein
VKVVEKSASPSLPEGRRRSRERGERERKREKREKEW